MVIRQSECTSVLEQFKGYNRNLTGNGIPYQHVKHQEKQIACHAAMLPKTAICKCMIAKRRLKTSKLDEHCDKFNKMYLKWKLCYMDTLVS